VDGYTIKGFFLQVALIKRRAMSQTEGGNNIERPRTYANTGKQNEEKKLPSNNKMLNKPLGLLFTSKKHQSLDVACVVDALYFGVNVLGRLSV
jgi:hypothetical protein